MPQAGFGSHLKTTKTLATFAFPIAKLALVIIMGCHTKTVDKKTHYTLATLLVNFTHKVLRTNI